MAKGRGRTRPKKDDAVPPTPEQMDAGCFRLDDVTDKRHGAATITIGKAYRRKPMIDLLLAQDVLDEAGHKALSHYRHHADLADRSPVRDSLCLQRGGSGCGPTIALLNAIAIVRDCEAAAGSLAGILRAVVVYDKSLSQYAIERHGAREEWNARLGRHVVKPRGEALKLAKLDLQMAAARVRAELDA